MQPHAVHRFQAVTESRLACFSERDHGEWPAKCNGGEASVKKYVRPRDAAELFPSCRGHPTMYGFIMSTPQFLYFTISLVAFLFAVTASVRFGDIHGVHFDKHAWITVIQ